MRSSSMLQRSICGTTHLLERIVDGGAVNQLAVCLLLTRGYLELEV